MSVYVGNLSYEVTAENLNEIFAEYGTVKKAQVPTDRETGHPRGFGFVEMGTDAEETAAIEALDVTVHGVLKKMSHMKSHGIGTKTSLDLIFYR